MGPLRLAAGPAVLLGLLGADSARADERIVAESSSAFANPAVAIDPGERVTFANRDLVAQHNVQAVRDGPGGGPLFASPVIGGGQEAAVAGAERLSPGAYDFFCTIHPAQMRGTLTVTGTVDTTPPVVRARLRAASLRTVLRSRKLTATVGLDEAAAAVLTARARGVTVARRSLTLPARKRSVALRLTAAGRRALRGRSRVAVSLTVRVQDLAGNAARASARRTLQR